MSLDAEKLQPTPPRPLQNTFKYTSLLCHNSCALSSMGPWNYSMKVAYSKGVQNKLLVNFFSFSLKDVTVINKISMVEQDQIYCFTTYIGLYLNTYNNIDPPSGFDFVL